MAASAISFACVVGGYWWGKKEGFTDGTLMMTNALLGWFELVAGKKQLQEWYRKDEIGSYMQNLHNMSKEDETLITVTVKFDIIEEEDE